LSRSFHVVFLIVGGLAAPSHIFERTVTRGEKRLTLWNDGLQARGCRFRIFADVYRCPRRG
jgi:hypothetical protein